MQSQNAMSPSWKGKTSVLLSHIKCTCFPIFNLKGSHWILALKSKSAKQASSWEQNVYFSSVLGGWVFVYLTSTCSNYIQVTLDTTGWNVILILFSLLSIRALCSIWWHFVYIIQQLIRVAIFCLLVLSRIHGTALAMVVPMHIFTTIFSGRLCFVCSTRHAVLAGTLVMCPRIVMAGFLGK